MSIQQENEQPTAQINEQDALALPSELVIPDKEKFWEHLTSWPPLQFLYQWFQTNTFSPTWIPERLQHPVIGVTVAVILQVVAFFATFLLVRIFPGYTIVSLLEVLAIALVALTWGAGPSIVATFAGVIFLNLSLAPSMVAWDLDNGDDVVERLTFLLVGLAITIVASQVGRARQKAEILAASLEIERNRLDAIIETVPDTVAIYDTQGKLMRINRAGREVTGPENSNAAIAEMPHIYDLRTADGLPFSPDDYPSVHALRGETVSSVEMHYTTPHGHERSILVSAAPLYSLQGNIEGIVSITHDISQLRQFEEEVLTHNKELETVFETMTDGIFVLHHDHTITRMNTAFRHLLGLTPANEANYFAKTVEERRSMLTMCDDYGQPLPDDQWPDSRILRGEVLNGSNAADIMFRRLDGQTLQLSVSGAPIYDAEGTITAALCICHDVTERRQLERRTQETLNALLAMAEALVLTPDTAPITGELAPKSASRVAKRIAELTCSVLGCQRVSITAIEPETEIMSPIAVVGLPPEQESQWWAEQPQNMRLSDSPMPELVAQLRANEVVILDMAQPPFDAAPNPYNVHILLTVPMSIDNVLVGLLALDHGGDTHRYTDNEIALAKAIAKLGALVIERERLLRERADARANELALREANRRMDEFLGMTSHELKTPLTSIKGNTQLTIRQLKTSLQSIQNMQSMMESTEQQIKLLDLLVNDLLDISRTQDSRLTLSEDECDLAALVREIVQEQQRIHPVRTITLNRVGDASLPVLADEARITQVITNYLTNALKYSPDAAPVEIVLRQEGTSAYFGVRDGGPGLNNEEQQQIWERFHRVHGVEVNSRSFGSSAGLGLGLYISKMIIEQHNGHVGVESAPNEGALFWFTLPLATES
ncbi:MAG TPA: PAS domain S-box protein [Ktedonobacteraceae bacterium]|nr:PAS domain S-box protein [Ktedonobacteraceae bacterium]